MDNWKLFSDDPTPEIQVLNDQGQAAFDVDIALLRLDKLHPEISGNKWYKIKYNLQAAREQGKKMVLTFGGPWSNHIAATAAACHHYGFSSIGIIRGEEPKKWSKTLSRAAALGMNLHFISREEYKLREDPDYLESLAVIYGQAYRIPAGGDNSLGVRGCTEILRDPLTRNYSHVCCPVGTGTTLSGLLLSARANQQVIGFSALKGDGDLGKKIAGSLAGKGRLPSWELISDYTFGGFAKKTDALIEFMRDFSIHQHVLLDFVYTAKMMYGIMDLTRNGYFIRGNKILAIHTGGLQGNESLDHKLGLSGEKQPH